MSNGPRSLGESGGEIVSTPLQGSELPLEHTAEYDSAANWFVLTGHLPANMASSGAIDAIQSDPESFQERVKQIRYAREMERIEEAEAQGL